MTEVSKLLENNDTVTPALVSLTTVANSAQTVAHIHLRFGYLTQSKQISLFIQKLTHDRSEGLSCP